MTEVKTRTAGYPASIRNKPEYLVGELGRHAVHYLSDRMLRALVWGADADHAGTLEIKVDTDGSLKIRRDWSPENPPFQGANCESLMSKCFQECLLGIRKGDVHQYDWVSGNPFQTIFLPVAVALSSEAKVKVAHRGTVWTQAYLSGEPKTPPTSSSTDAKDAYLELELSLDSNILGSDFQVYPYRIRLREFAHLVPGLEVSLKYKSFKALVFKSESGLTDLLSYFVPLEDRLHEQPFVFHYQEGDLSYDASVYLIHSAMERFKSFIDFDETYHGGVHDRLLRKTIRSVVRRIHKLEIPQRRQSLHNIASSRMSYFGQFGSSVPHQDDQRRNEHVRTVPGVAAVLRVCSPRLEADNNFRARLVGPKLEKNVGPALDQAFRNWVLQNDEAIHEWRKQWIPKKRKKRQKKKAPAAKKAEPANLKEIDQVLDK